MPDKFTLHTQMAAQAYEDMLADLGKQRDNLFERLGSLKIEPAASFSFYMVIKELEFRQKTLVMKTAVEIDLMVKAQLFAANNLLKGE